MTAPLEPGSIPALREAIRLVTGRAVTPADQRYGPAQGTIVSLGAGRWANGVDETAALKNLLFDVLRTPP